MYFYVIQVLTFCIFETPMNIPFDFFLAYFFVKDSINQQTECKLNFILVKFGINSEKL